MGVSGSKRGHANRTVLVAEGKFIDVGMRYESAFDVPRRALAYRLRQESGDALCKALVGSGSLSAQRKPADKAVIRVFVRKAYGDLICRHEWPIEMVTGFILRTAFENSTEMIDVEVVSHCDFREGVS